MSDGPTTDPLDGLDAIGWASMAHAYGPAADVPGQIRGLASADPRTREESLYCLFGTIFHQGGRFEASAFAVPFLLRLLAHPDVPDRAGIADLLAGLAIGFDTSYLPHPVPIAALRARASGAPVKVPPPPRRLRKPLSSPGRSIRSERCEDGPEYRQWRSLRHSAQLGWEVAAYDAVAAGAAVFAGLLGDEVAALRLRGAYLLAWFPEHAALSVPSLLNAAQRERDPAVAATMLVAAGLAGGDSADGLRRPCGRWCWRWPGTIRAGATGAFTAS